MRLIDADALLEDLKKTGRYFQAKFDIENAPTVTIQKWKEEMPDYIQRAMLDSLRQQGKWLCDNRHSKCSICNFETVIDTYNFCPNCGAEMRGDYNEDIM